MNVTTLHRRVVRDVSLFREQLDQVLPVEVPECYALRMSTGRLVNQINAVTLRHGIYTEVYTSTSITPGAMFTSGVWWDSKDRERPHCDIGLLFGTHPNARVVGSSQHLWRRRRMFFWQALMHELIHRHQGEEKGVRVYRSHAQDSELREEQQYLGNTDEIEAFSHDAAVEVHVHWPHLSLSQAFAKPLEDHVRRSTTYAMYARSFKDDPEHPAMRHFLRKTRAWFDVVKSHAAYYDSLRLWDN